MDYIYSVFIPIIQTILLILYVYLNGFIVKLLKRENTLISIKKYELTEEQKEALIGLMVLFFIGLMVLLAFSYIPLDSSYSLLLCALAPIKVYENVNYHKAQILKDNKGKYGIYL
jgi:hypothetical protein